MNRLLQGGVFLTSMLFFPSVAFADRDVDGIPDSEDSFPDVHDARLYEFIEEVDKFAMGIEKWLGGVDGDALRVVAFDDELGTIFAGRCAVSGVPDPDVDPARLLCASGADLVIDDALSIIDAIDAEALSGLLGVIEGEHHTPALTDEMFSAPDEVMVLRMTFDDVSDVLRGDMDEGDFNDIVDCLAGLGG
ncbi:MAG: hypothetical protein AAFV53_05335 [Myxococcota bacterium]